MNYEQFKTNCLSRPGAEETYPFGDHAVWFTVMGKVFAWTFVREATVGKDKLPPFSFVNLKCDPERALSLRESYAAVRPGWHQSKKHWNSVYIDDSVSDAQLCEWIDHSYDTVVRGLTKSQRRQLQGEYDEH